MVPKYYPFGSRLVPSVYGSVSAVVTRRASDVVQASRRKGLGLSLAVLKTTNRREQNVKSINGGIEITRATTTLAPVMDKTSETISMAISQYSVTCNKYNASWRRYCWLLH